jgi:hypothetical protein
LAHSGGVSSFLVGDKVKLKAGEHRGSRGRVEAFDGDSLVIRTQGMQGVIAISPSEVMNFSLAARKAWLSMPKRQVGRPKGSKVFDRVSVSLRIDRDLWEEFRTQEKSGLIADRSATINAWFKEKLGKCGSCNKDHVGQDH